MLKHVCCDIVLKYFVISVCATQNFAFFLIAYCCYFFSGFFFQLST